MGERECVVGRCVLSLEQRDRRQRKADGGEEEREAFHASQSPSSRMGGSSSRLSLIDHPTTAPDAKMLTASKPSMAAFTASDP
jgi:hypothetical protein